MNLNETIDKHEKAIKILLLIGDCERLIEMHEIVLKKTDNHNGSIYQWNLHRKSVMNAIKSKLERYYNSTFKIN